VTSKINFFNLIKDMISHLQFMLKIYLLNQKTVRTIPYFILKLNI